MPRRERREQLSYNLLFRWFVGLTMDDSVWDATTFTKNRDRPLNQETARSFFRQVVERARGLMSNEHFTVDGTLIEAWASQKSFQRKLRGLENIDWLVVVASAAFNFDPVVEIAADAGLRPWDVSLLGHLRSRGGRWSRLWCASMTDRSIIPSTRERISMRSPGSS